LLTKLSRISLLSLVFSLRLSAFNSCISLYEWKTRAIWFDKTSRVGAGVGSGASVGGSVGDGVGARECVSA